MAKADEPAPPEAPENKGVLARIDDAVFAIEMSLIAAFLGSMAVAVFVDVVAQRMSARESKLASAVVRFFGPFDEETAASLNETLPKVGAAIFALFVAAVMRKRVLDDNPEAGMGAVVGKALAAVAAVFGTLYMIDHDAVPSWGFFIGLYVVFAAGVIRASLGQDGAAPRIAGVVVAGLVFSAFAKNYFPDGYSWSKEFSTILMLWVGFLGASICAHEGKHLRLEALHRLVPDNHRRWVDAAGMLITAGACAALAYMGHDYVFNETTGSIAMEAAFEQTNIPDWMGSIAIPVAFGLAAIRFAAGAVSAAMGGNYAAIGEGEH